MLGDLNPPPKRDLTRAGSHQGLENRGRTKEDGASKHLMAVIEATFVKLKFLPCRGCCGGSRISFYACVKTWLLLQRCLTTAHAERMYRREKNCLDRKISQPSSPNLIKKKRLITTTPTYCKPVRRTKKNRRSLCHIFFSQKQLPWEAGKQGDFKKQIPR